MSASSTTAAEVCAVCSVPAVQKCSGCRSVFYCNREHQKRHWKEHSKKCRPFKVEKDSRVGRHYVSLKDIAPGTLVFVEREPLVAGPPQNTAPICLGCYRQLTAETAVPCEKCGWPLCGGCEKHGPECEFTLARRDAKVSIRNYEYPHPTYNCVTIVRALCLRESDPERYEKLLNLEDHCDEASEARDGFDGPREVARFVKRFFDLEDVAENEVARIAGVLQVNGHEVPTTEPAHVAVYDLASLLEHSCRANCSKTFTNEGGLVIRTALPIAKGDHLSICYTDPLWGVANRRHHLARTKFFDCTCDRCGDPTEYGTMFNSIVCDKGGCGGFMLPPTFLCHGEIKPDYVCNACDNAVSWDSVDRLMEEIGLDLSRMQKGDVKACRDFIERHATKIHENHYYNTDVKLALAQIIGQQGGGLPVVDDELLSEKIALCEKLEKLLHTLVPAENRVRGLVLFELHAAIAEFGRRRGPDELKGMLMDSRKILAKAYELLRHEPDILPEGKVALHARKNLQDMDIILGTLCRNTVAPM